MANIPTNFGRGGTRRTASNPNRSVANGLQTAANDVAQLGRIGQQLKRDY